MCKLFGCLINEAQLVAHGLYPFRHLLGVSEAESPFSWGIAHHHLSDVLIKRRPRFMGALDFYRRVSELHATAIVGDVHKLGNGPTVPENTQPFRFRNWTCAHRGEVPRFEQIRPWILNSIPHFLRRNIVGATDSEHLFHLFLAFLYDDGLLDARDVSEDALTRAIRNTFRTVERFLADAGGGEADLNVLVTNGRVMALAAHGQVAYHVALDGLKDCDICRQPPEGWNQEPRRRDHDHLKLALLLMDPPSGVSHIGLQRTDPKSIIFVDQQYRMSVTPLMG